MVGKEMDPAYDAFRNSFMSLEVINEWDSVSKEFLFEDLYSLLVENGVLHSKDGKPIKWRYSTLDYLMKVLPYLEEKDLFLVFKYQTLIHLIEENFLSHEEVMKICQIGNEPERRTSFYTRFVFSPDRPKALSLFTYLCGIRGFKWMDVDPSQVISEDIWQMLDDKGVSFNPFENLNELEITVGYLKDLMEW